MEEGMTLDLPAGLVARPATATDADVIFELVAACEVDADGVTEVDMHDITVAFGRHGFDPSLDTLLVFDGEELVGRAELFRRRSEGDVRPSHRAGGIGTALLEWIEARGRAVGDADVGQTKTDANAGARELFLAMGYEPAWTAWVIRIALDEVPRAPQVPAGISIRPFRPSDATAAHAVLDAAFSEWDATRHVPYEVWASEEVVHPAFVPELSPLAFEGEELVGVALSHDYPYLGEGWIEELATKGTHRRRGIAQALLLTAFGWFHERGRQTASLSTDSRRTGALALYERVGMRLVRQYTRYAKDLG
jgi:GNAT superfamily N-acetyltransferase